ncbi:MAG: insulinase family protein, partial [Acidobacteriota bacterium]|nr:insulinase family protein [Acidobacteriota bacterium]
MPTAEDLRAFWGRWPGGYFAPRHLVLTVASPVPAGETLAMVRDYFSGGADAEPVRGPYPTPRAHGGGEIIEPGDAPQVSVIAARLADVEPADRAALLTALDALSDRMVARIREELGLAYRLGAGVRVVPGGGWLLSASVGTRPENQEQVRALLDELIAELRTGLVDPERLERLAARRRLSAMLRGLSAASRAYRLGRRLLEGPGSTPRRGGCRLPPPLVPSRCAPRREVLDPDRIAAVDRPVSVTRSGDADLRGELRRARLPRGLPRAGWPTRPPPLAAPGPARRALEVAPACRGAGPRSTPGGSRSTPPGGGGHQPGGPGHRLPALSGLDRPPPTTCLPWHPLCTENQLTYPPSPSDQGLLTAALLRRGPPGFLAGRRRPGLELPFPPGR